MSRQLARTTAWVRGGKSVPLIFGHRGVRPVKSADGVDPRGELPPENTLAAFERAYDEGADGIELDVRLCATGEVVVHHDVDLSRMTDNRDTRQIKQLTLPELYRVELVGGHRIPRLAEVLRFCEKTGLRINIEAKHDEPDLFALAKAIAQALEAHPLPFDRVVISSFHPRALAFLRAILPHRTLAFITHEGQRKHRPWLISKLLPCDGVHPEHTMVADVLKARAARSFVGAWTVNDPLIARSLADQGVDVLITDTPAKIRVFLSG